jgi:tol-pal system protein YbgF
MNHRSGVLLAIAVILAVTLSAPMEAANKEHQQMMADLRMLQLQTQALQAQLTALTDALKTVSTRLDEQAGLTRKASADAKVQVDAVAGDLRVVREKVDETNVRLSSLSQEVEALRLAQVQVQAAAAAGGAPGEPAAAGGDPAALPAAPAANPAQPVTGVPSPGMSPQRMFESARADYYAGQWGLAIQGFETYLRTFPKTDLTDDAQYYIGETQYMAHDYKQAVAAYDRLIATYPTSNTLPDAYYKRGLALNTLGQAQPARESFEFVVKNYPDSDAGRLAQQALDRLNNPRR